MIEQAKSCTAPAKWGGIGNALLAALICAYGLIFLWYYPLLPGIEDEVGFINQTILWDHGAIVAERVGLHAPLDFVPVRGKSVSWRNPGRSLITLPLYHFGGLRAIFVAGAVIHIVTVVVGSRLLALFEVNPLWAVLLLFHPSLALYSRTVMGDPPAAMFLLLAIYSAIALRRLPLASGIACGLCIGLAAVMRYQCALVLPFVLAAMAMDRLENRNAMLREQAGCVVAAGVIGAGLIAYNLALFGNPIGWTEQGYFSVHFFWPHAISYCGTLLILWPLMPLVAALDPTPMRRFTLALTLPIVGLFLTYYFIDRGSTFVQTVVVSQRLILPAVPALVISYVLALNLRILPRSLGFFGRSWTPIFSTVAAVAIGIALFGATIYSFSSHQRHLKELTSMRDAIYKTVPQGERLLVNSTAGKLVSLLDPATPVFDLSLLPTTSQGWSYELNLHRPIYLAFVANNISAGIGGDGSIAIPKLKPLVKLGPLSIFRVAADADSGLATTRENSYQ